MKCQNLHFNKKHERGFTLIELLVTIVIMTILAGIGAGIFTGTNQKLQVQKAANNLLMMAQYARMEAIEQQRAFKLYVDNANQEFYLLTTIVDEENGTAEEIVIDDPIVAPVVLDGSIEIKDVRIITNDYNSGGTSSNQYIITFSPDGTSQASVIQIGDEKTNYTLSINEITGKSKLYAGTIDNVKVDTIDIDAEYY